MPAWTANTSYSVGTIVSPTAGSANGLVFRCTTAGTSGATQPTWATTINSSVTDNTVTWLAVSATSSDLQAIAPSAIIELFELQLVQALHGSNDIYRFHAGTSLNSNGPVFWNGNSYTRYPVEVEGFEYSGNGQLPQPKLRVSNINGTITSLLLIVNSITTGNDLIGAKVTRIRTLARYIDAGNFPGNVNPYGTPDPTVEFPREVFYVSRKAAESRDVVEFELSAAFDLQGVRAPKRQCISNICQWVYRSAECGYTGTSYFDENDNSVGSAALDVCGKRLSSCEKRFGALNQLPFGSFPGVGTYFA